MGLVYEHVDDYVAIDGHIHAGAGAGGVGLALFALFAV